ncbi:MAG TPA: OmpA family protein [Steroidobacteraceae bacterium]|jgi:outer membrane protein OmpA-like peptidoglycan-associated protein
MFRRRLTLLAAMVALAVAQTGIADPDVDSEGCKDFFVSRITGYVLGDCQQLDFDSFVFDEGGDHATTVEGKIVHNTYSQPDSATQHSQLFVENNYMNALTAGGWTIVAHDRDHIVAKQIKNGAERWVQMDSNAGHMYVLHLAQKAGMQQSVVTADDMATALNRDGRISLHINFDTGKSTIRPDSQPIVDQIVATLKGNSALQLTVEGHTDNVGTPQANQTLSQSRAQAVVTAVTGAGIAAPRLTAVGYGQTKPVADNSTDAGRAQNRRVDLVKK